VDTAAIGCLVERSSTVASTCTAGKAQLKRLSLRELGSHDLLWRSLALQFVI